MAGQRNRRRPSGNVSMADMALARSRMPPLQDPRVHPARCDPASAEYADLETGGRAEMPVKQEGAIRAARSPD